MMLKRGSKGDAVRSVQEMLNYLGVRQFSLEGGEPRYVPLVEDGVFGKLTEHAVLDFQEQQGVLMDGIVGPITFGALEDAYIAESVSKQSPGGDTVDGAPERLLFRRVDADKWGGGYDRLWLRSDAAERYGRVLDQVHARGGKLTSSGGRRALMANVGTGRSATSFHYTGRALDLFIYSGMVNPALDPYVIVREAPREYRVFARCNAQGDEPPTTLDRVMTYQNRKGELEVEGHFLDLTQLFEAEGFRPIRARPRFESGGSMLGAEWWHFQWEFGMTKGITTFGGELLKVFSEETLRGTPPWRHRDRIYGVNWN